MIKNKIKKVQKREGEIVPFDQERITSAILKSGQATAEFNGKIAGKISDKVVEMLNQLYGTRKKPPNIEEIQDVVEIAIMKNGYTTSAKAYILYRRERQKIREAKKEVLSGKTTKLPLSLNALKVVAKRYLLQDREKKEVTETPEEMFQRVAKTLAGVEKKYKTSTSKIKKFEKDFYNVMANFEFLPAGRTLTNAGASTPVVSNCIVLHIEDNMEGIFQTLKDAALLQQAGSGLGFPFHMLRPAGSLAKRTMGVSSGPVSFLRVYNEAFGIIKQQSRHGANMAVMRVDHPDILDFIHCKEKEGEIRNFNISVSLTDDFMRKVESKSKEFWVCKFKNKKILPRRIIRDEHGIVLEIKEEKITAEQVMYEIVNAAWANGEPGIIFIDEVNRVNPLPGLGRIEACNPCGEQMLHDGDVCNLGSINLDKFIENKKIKWEKLRDVVRTSIRMLDNVIDITKFPIERVSKMFKNNRRVGLGLMGFADMLFQLDIPYNSEEGFKTAEKVMKFITEESHKMSEELAKEKGVFPNYKKSVWKKKGQKVRNAATTTIAPTGSISMVVNVSSGLEPCFALAYVKEVMGGQKFFYTNRHLEERLRKEDIFTERLAQKIATAGGVQQIKEIPDRIKKVFIGALDISPLDHIKMQAAFQKNVDNSISKTINFPNKSPQIEVLKAYLLAWKLKCKSCTVYREASRKTEVLTLAAKKDKKFLTSTTLELLEPQANICPECGGPLQSQEGCLSCPQCGFGLCSV
ncbi:MAG TPA: adenosylcobalamin-dependent ribonucleoside-diphosphate reductase [Candidatus Parcubacteria bacterium]|jgi:ribonucleoside-diphosphate reductase alpha chain|nr:adenosylcobalamin-dependent ribonucleoside-diphosphate reductase [Candidatus Parcubacteria bacterium]